MSKAKVMTGAERKAALLVVGANLASKHGAVNVTRRMVAKAGKVSEGLVSNYFGPAADAQKAYKRKMKALGMSEPAKDRIEAIGAKLRAHGPRDVRDTRKRSAKEVKAIKDKKAAAIETANGAVRRTKPLVKVRKVAAPAVKPRAVAKVRKPKSAATAAPETKPTAPPSTKPTFPPALPPVGPASTPATGPAEVKTAARAPMAPPLAALL
jgi:hypothetical protein